MERRGVRIDDTFAEAFDMRAARVVITAGTPGWALTAARAMTGSPLGIGAGRTRPGPSWPRRHARRAPGVRRAAFDLTPNGPQERWKDLAGRFTGPTTACLDVMPMAAEGSWSARVCACRRQMPVGKLWTGKRYWRMGGGGVPRQGRGVQRPGGGTSDLARTTPPSRRRSPPSRPAQGARRDPSFTGGSCSRSKGARSATKMIASPTTVLPDATGRRGVKSALKEE